MRIIHLMDVHDVGELAMIKSLLDGNRIPYVIHDEHVSSLYPGVPLLVSRIMVDDSHRGRAITLLSRLRLPIREASASV
jgi:Putative prokaryotic signal transducing protein